MQSIEVRTVMKWAEDPQLLLLLGLRPDGLNLVLWRRTRLEEVVVPLGCAREEVMLVAALGEVS